MIFIRSGPISYAGLIPGGTTAPPIKQPRKIKTFQDVAGAGQRDAGAVPLVPLSQTDWLPPVFAAPKPQGKAFIQGSAEEEAIHLQPSPVAPIDWTLKRTACFSSPAPFTVCQEARSAPRSDGEQMLLSH